MKGFGARRFIHWRDGQHSAAAREHQKLPFRFGSVFGSELVAELVDQWNLVVHLAAAVGVRLIIESPVRRRRH